MSRFFASRGDVATHYALFNGTNLSTSPIQASIGAATRQNSVWTEYGANPILSPGSSGSWEDQQVRGPCLVWDGSQFRLYYDAYDGTNFRVGLATFPSWPPASVTRHASNPLIGAGTGVLDTSTIVAFAAVLYEPTDTGKEWKMWVEVGPTSLGAGTIYYLHSTDGISWTSFGEVIAKGAGGTWNDEGVSPGAICKEAGTYYLFVQGRQGTTNPRWQGGLYTFTDPEGTYTADAGNPIILARFNTANTTQTVTGNATVTAGATTVPLPTPSAFNVGEPVVLVDGNGAVDPFVGYLTAVGASDVTLDRPVTSTYTGASGFRSHARNSVIPRSILPRPSGGYEAFVSLFQPVEDLVVPGTKLYEGAFEMRANALTGTWTYYYVAGRGLLFPLVTGASWHTRSAENPSVIAAP